MTDTAAQRRPTLPARREAPAPIPIAPGLMPDAEQIGRIALAVIGEGNLDQMTDEAKTRFVIEASRMLGLNPVMGPFLVVKFEGRSVLYLTKAGAEQLAGLHRVSTEVTSKGVEFGLYTVTVRARQGERFAEATGAVPFETADGKMIPIAQRARVIKIAETQARRRSILALIGLGFLDRPGMPDPDQMLDRHGNIATRQRRPERTLPPATQADLDALSTDEPVGPEARAIVPDDQAGAVPSSEGTPDEAPAPASTAPADHDAEADWTELGDDPTANSHDAAGNGPRWAGTPLGRQVSAIADQLVDAGKRFSLPADDATDSDLEGWLSSKRAVLGPRP